MRTLRNLKKTFKKKKFKKKKIRLNHKCHYFHMWVLCVEIKSSTTINNFHNKQYLHIAHIIGVGFENSKPLQTWC